MLLLLTSLFAALAGIVILKKSRRTNGQSNRLPPGPPADLIIGHARKIPHERSWETFAEWGKNYGDVVSAYAFGTTLIILNSVVTAHNLLVSRSPTFSGRPWMPLNEMMGWGTTMPLLPYGPRLRKQRRMMQKHFNSQALSSFKTLQEDEVRKFLCRLLARPANFLDDIHGLVTRIILLIVYGHEVVSEDDPLIELVERCSRASTGAGSPGTTILDLFPPLRHIPAWLPGMNLKRHALETRKLVDQASNVPYDEIRAKKVAGRERPCLISYLLDEYEEAGIHDSDHEEDVRAVGLAAYIAGNDTTKAVISTFFMMMALHPEVVKQAQDEIDRIVGLDRLPTLDDRTGLPFVGCILKELYRINPPVPLGAPHLSEESDIYRAWTIPSGSLVIANIWQMMRDEDFFPDPDAFDPGRHAHKTAGKAIPKHDDETLDNDSSTGGDDDPSSIVFGFGRRACPGRLFADTIIWLTMANVLAAFDIQPYKDPVSGNDVPPEFAFESGIVTPPKAFKCAIVPRSSKHVQIVRAVHG
ncbi:cytochrome P450 [Phellopilus nigrolimitatus]|nr:cytochrome P450 [Phellopilus nigrolimitatus]